MNEIEGLMIRGKLFGRWKNKIKEYMIFVLDDERLDSKYKTKGTM